MTPVTQTISPAGDPLAAADGLTDNPVRIRPITPVFGAFIENLPWTAASGESSPELTRIIKEAFDKYLVLVFEPQEASAQALRSFVRQFGPLFVHHADDGVIPVDEAPEVLQMLKEPEGDRLFGGVCWHADVTFRKPAGYLSALHAKQLPPVGGDTLFASTVAAFSALSSGMQQLLRKLEAVHSYSGPDAPDHPSETAVHPVVRRHPETGVEGIYLNRMFATRFVGMTKEESEPLLKFLDEHMTRCEFTARISWAEGQLVMWDNRFTLHYPINDFLGHRRLLYRCTAMEY
ncbi:MAG: TauD/TfdA dioxygenase family protein [Arenicellales bacterium]